MEWFNYLLKVSACSAFFLAFYLLVLRKLTFFKINRFYLLFALLLSFVIPTLQFTVERELTAAPIIEAPVVVQNENLTEQFSLAPITAPNVSLPVEESYNWFNLLPFLYSTVVVGLLGLATWRLFRLIKHAKQNIKEINGLKLVHKSNGFTNCSFFNYVFIDENSLTESELQIMLRHEEVHAKQYHSVDKIILIIVKAVLWFNPIVYLYDKALEQIHEYEADEVTSRNFGTASYANLLLRLAVIKSDMPLVHNFVKSPIKERIKMLFNSKSKHMKKLLYLLALPIGMGLLWGFTVDVVDVVPKNNDLAISQDQPFIQRTNLKTDKGYTSEQITLNTVNGKPTNIKIGYSGEAYQKAELWLYINNKLYSEEDAQKFDKNYIAKLSEKRGYGSSKDYNLPVINANKFAYVFWFGNEPKLSDYTAKNRMYWEKYNGKTIEGKVIGYTFSPTSKVVDGFLVKTTNGETLKANVEAKFATQTQAMIGKDDQVSIKIYNANYWKDTKYPVLTSYKISKGGKLLYDRWPKTAAHLKATNEETLNIVQNQQTKMLPKPTLLSSTRMTVDTKSNISYIQNGTMEIYGEQLIAEDITWDMNKGIIKAEKATLTKRDGAKISSQAIEYDLKKGTYISKSTSSGSVSNSSVFNLFSNLNYQAMDSTRVSKTENTVTLYGKAKVNLDGKMLSGDKIEVNKNSAIVTAYNAELTGVDKEIIKAKVIAYNTATKKIMLKDVLRNGVYWDRVIN
ncbi:MAG: M56 family metallopeptidase [Sphingobacteriaceae bacterium]|nr:M56 family metallopeptidase [Sphingobacteriaceae bacterium]